MKSLPDDASLPKDVVQSLVNEIQVKHNEIEFKCQEKIHHLEEQLRSFKNELFGRSSERRLEPPPDQLSLFNSNDRHGAEESQRPDDTIVIAAHARKKRGRKSLSKDLPRIDIIHDHSEDQKQCACGAQLSRFGQEVSEKLDYIPARLRVERHIRYKYACKNCQGVEDDGPTVRIAPVPVQLIPKSNASAGFWAHIAVSKFADGLPLAQTQQFLKKLLPQNINPDSIAVSN